MKDLERDNVINFHSENKQSTMETVKTNISQSLFSLLIVLLKNQKVNVWFETTCLFFQLLQLLAFPFNPIFASVWKNETLFAEISSILQYSQFSFFFQNNKEMYLIAFYLCAALVLFLYIDVIYVSFTFSNNRLNIMWPLHCLQSSLLLFTNALYLPILSLFLSMFTCVSADKSNNIYVESIQCWTGEFYIHAILGLFFAILFFCFCLFFQMTFVETKFNSLNPLAKSSSKLDVVFFCSKTLLMILFTFFFHPNNQWFLIGIMIFISSYLLYYYHDVKPYYNVLLIKNYIGTYLIFLWANLVLIIAKVLETSEFDGSIPLFFLGVPVIVLTIGFQNDDIIPILLTNITKFSNGEKALIQIREYFHLIYQRDSSRNAKIKLKGYIIQYEEQCSLYNCALKKYIGCIQNTTADGFVFLLQHGEMMYQNAITKFPQCGALRISYAFFLIEKMNKKRQADLELFNAEKQSNRLEELFIIFRYRRLLEDYSTEINEDEDNLDIVSNIAYKNHMTLFKSSINKASILYLDFWSLLLNPNQDNHEDLTKLNDYGTKINILVEEVNTHFTKMQKLKLNDQEAIKLYSDFLNDILNDKEKAIQYKSKINEIEDTMEVIDDNNFATADLNAINTNDELQFIIASAQADKFGVITQISLGICSMFGYTKGELIGKTIEVLMPDIYHKAHRSLLTERVNDFKKHLIDINELLKYKPTYTEIITFGKSKSRYLVPLTFKTALIPTESNDIIFIAKIWMDHNSSLLSSIQQYSYIMTNNYFIIQNFTANAVNMLGLSSSVLSNNIEVTDFIKQFSEYFLRYAVENEDKTPEQKLIMKRNLISKKFKTNTYINWKKNDLIHPRVKNSRCVDLQSTIANDLFNDNSLASNILTKTTPEDRFMLIVSEIIVNKSQEGYIFKFEAAATATAISHNASPIGKLNGATSVNNLAIDHLRKKSIQSNSQIQQQQDYLKEMQHNKLKVDSAFIPESKNSFQLDTKTLSFKQGLVHLVDLKDYLRKEAVKKIQSNTLNTKESLEEEDDDNNEESNNSESGVYSSSFENNGSEISNENEDKQIAIKQKCVDEYYKINTQHIKYSCYDYAKGMIIEIKNYDKSSQVQKKMSDADNEKEDESKEKKKEDPNTPNIIKDIVQDQIEKDKRKENILMKQIEYALGKEESQPTITKMRWICFAVFIMFLAFGGGIMALILLSLTTIKENMSLIEKAFDLLTLNSVGIYHCRELTLLQNENYTSLPAQKELHLNNTFNSTLTIFSTSHALITYIITTFLTISEENNYLLLNSTLMSAIIEDDYNVSYFNLTYSSAIIEVNTALFHTGHSELMKIVMTNKDAFFYLYNSLNEIEISFGNQANILLNELKLNTSSIRLTFSVVLGVIIVLIVCIYFILSYGYNGIARRKESYLEVFFEIGNGVIKSSLEKCENFSKKFQTESIHESQSSSSDDNDIGEDSSILSKDHDKKEQRSKRGNSTSREAKIIKTKFGVILVFISLFAVLSFTFYFLYLTTLEGFMEYYKNTAELNNEYLMLFNGLREFMFDKNSNVMKNNSLVYLNSLLEGFYLMKSNKTHYINQYQSLIPQNYNADLAKIYKESACTLNQYFVSLEECESFMSNSTNYGLEIALNYFVEEIRLAKNNAEQFHVNQTKTKFKYNLTLTGTDLWKSYWPKNEANMKIYREHDSINLFNKDLLHLKLNILFVHIILPNFNYLVEVLRNSYDLSFQNMKLIYIIVPSVYLCLILAGYIFMWLPYETKMNQTIYKTKNMLSIIPKEVLASLSNIHKLLNINQNVLKGSMRNAT